MRDETIEIDDETRKAMFEFAMSNTKYDSQGRATISKDDEWLKETEWDDLFEQLKKKQINK